MTGAEQDDARLARGLAVLRALGQEHVELLQRLEHVAPDLARCAIAFGYGDLQGRSALDLSSRTLVAVASLAAAGASVDQLALHLRSARAAGWTPAELTEVLMQLAIHVGFPRAIDALQALRTVLAAEEEEDAR